MRVPANIKAEVETKLRNCIAMAEHAYGQKFKFPAIRYDIRGTVAGRADIYGWEVKFNPILLMENIDDFINRTVPHEMAHLVDYQLHPENFESTVTWVPGYGARRTKRDIHGYTWKSIMIVFGADPSRCHSYDTKNARVKKRGRAKHVWSCCGCGREMHLGPVRHRNMIGGAVQYWMRDCRHHGGYKYVGLEGQTKKVALPKVADASHNHPTKKAGGSKLDACRELYSSVLTREENIRSFISVGCTPAGASSYYAKIKKEMGV